MEQAVSCDEQQEKYKGLFLGTTTVPSELETLNAGDMDGEAKIKAREANKNAYGDLILANAHHVAFNIVDKVVTTDLPNGDAHKAWNDLGKKYDSKTLTTIVQLSNQFINLKLTNITDNPEEWIMELEILQARLDQMGYEISDKHLLIHILHNVPEEYDSVVEADKKMLTDSTNLLDIETLKTHLHDKWVKLGLRRGTYDNDVNGKALIRE